MLMKMLGRETRVTRAIQRFHLFAPIRRNPLAVSREGELRFRLANATEPLQVSND